MTHIGLNLNQECKLKKLMKFYLKSFKIIKKIYRIDSKYIVPLKLYINFYMSCISIPIINIIFVKYNYNFIIHFILECYFSLILE